MENIKRLWYLISQFVIHPLIL